MDNTQELVKFLVSQDADIIALQECTRDLDANVYKKYRTKSDLDKDLWDMYQYWFFWPQRVAKHISKDGNPFHHNFWWYIEQGNYTMSKYPIVSAANYYVHKQYDLEVDHSYRWNDDHPRSVASTVINHNEKKYHVLNLHGWRSKDKRWNKNSVKQCRELVRLAKIYDFPTLLIWDFNLLPDSEGIKIIESEFINHMTHSSITRTRPWSIEKHIDVPNIVDYVFTSQDIVVSNLTCIETDISDHYPLIVEFE